MLQAEDRSVTGCPIANETEKIGDHIVEPVRADNWGGRHISVLTGKKELNRRNAHVHCRHDDREDIPGNDKERN
jgi:hypothetical protein